MHVYRAICQVSAELAKEGIRKDRSNQQQGYKFRGIDDCLNALAPLLASHGLVIIPEVQEREQVERETRQGGALFYVTVKVKYTFASVEDDSSCAVVTYGEAMDSADKATNKAMSAAYKYAVIQTFCIPTEGDNDADATTHDVAAKPAVQVARKVNQENMKTMKKVEQDGAGDPGGSRGKNTSTRQASDAAPPLITDEQWDLFLDYMADDPERTNVGKQLKGLLGVPKVSDLTGDLRKSFILQFQDSCRDTGVICSEWVKE